MINWFKGLQHPEAFHGKDSRSPYFEGWYHKLVSKTKRSIVIIPGKVEKIKMNLHLS